MIKKRLCPVHGLWNKTVLVTRCPLCNSKRNKVYNKFKRDKSSADIYKSSRWRKIREIKLSNSPFCVKCGQPAIIVDHIKELKDGGDPYDLENLQTMCRSCHNIKTIEEKTARRGRLKC